jgi:hypothetical protein
LVIPPEAIPASVTRIVKLMRDGQPETFFTAPFSLIRVARPDLAISRKEAFWIQWDHPLY